VESLSSIFGERLPDSTFLTQNEGAFDNQVVFVLHPNGDVQAHQWVARSYQWVNLGQYSYERKRIEGQLEKEKLRGQKIGGGLPPNTVQYFLAVAKQREQDCKNNSTDVPQIPFQAPVASLSELETRYPPQRVDASSGHYASLPSAGSSTFTTLPKMKATTAMTTVATAPQQHPSMNTNPFIDDPLIVRPADNQIEFNECASSPTPANSNLSLITQRQIVGDDHNKDTIDKGKSVATAEQMDRLPTDPLRTHGTHGPSSAIAGPSVSEGHDYWAAESIQGPDASQKRVCGQGQEQMPSDLWSHQGQPTSYAFQMALSGKEALRFELESHKLSRQDSSSLSAPPIGLENIRPGSAILDPVRGRYGLTDAVIYRVPAVDFTTQQLRRIGGLENVSSDQSGSLSARRVLREGEVEPVWLDRQSSIFQKGAATSNMSNEELELFSSPTPQNWNGPFFPDIAPKASDLLTPGSTASKKSREEELAEWWHSGNMRERQEDYLKVLQKTAASGAAPRGESSNDWNLDHALYPVFENLKAYVEEGTHKPRDYFARFAKPPEWCINNTPAGRNSFFGEDYGTPPARLGRYVTKPFGGSTPCLPSLRRTFENALQRISRKALPRF